MTARVRKAEADAAQAELDLELRRGQVVDQDFVRKLAATIRGEHRDGLLALQASLPGQLENVSADQAREILTTAIHAHLTGLQEALKE